MTTYETPERATIYLWEHIPLTKAMEATVERLDAREAVLTAPLEPNINHRHTAFGGSIASLATLAAWTYLHFRLRAELSEITVRVVIAGCEIGYHLPIDTEMMAVCPAPESGEWERFRDAVRKRGKGRLRLHATISTRNNTGRRPAATFVGTFVALRSVGDTEKEPEGDLAA